MKKTLAALLLACMLLAASLPCLAEAAPADATLDFGDFTLTVDPDMLYSMASEKKSNEVWLMVYPAYHINGDNNSNFNVVWTDQKMSVSAVLAQYSKEAYAAMLKGQIELQYASAGVTVKSFSLPTLKVQSLNGKDALSYIMVTEVEYMGMEQTIYQIQAIVSEDFGTYTFTGSSNSMEALEKYVAPLFDTIGWKE